MTEVGKDDEPSAALPHPEVMTVPDDARSDLELARLIGRSLVLAARKIGVQHHGVGFDDLVERLLTGAQGCRLEPAAYQAIWDARALLARPEELTG